MISSGDSGVRHLLFSSADRRRSRCILLTISLPTIREPVDGNRASPGCDA
jgi:hypothetical protein